MTHRHKRPPHYQRIAKYGERAVFHALGTIWAYLKPSMAQVLVVAQRDSLAIGMGGLSWPTYLGFADNRAPSHPPGHDSINACVCD